MSEENITVGENQASVEVGSEEIQVQQESVGVLPSAMALFTGGIKFAMSRMDIIGIVFVVMLVVGIVSVVLDSGPLASMSIPMLIVSIIATIIGMVNTAVLIYAFANHEKHPSYSDGVRWVGKNFFAYIWLSLCITFLKMGGFVLLIIPGIVVSVYTSFSMMVFATEGKRGFAAIMRSRQLTYGRFWKTMGVFLLLSISALFVMCLIGGSVVLMGDAALSFVASEALVPLLVTTSVVTAFQIVVTAFGFGLVAHVYHRYAQVTPPQETDNKIRKKYITIAWFALAIPVLGILASVMLASLNAAQDKGQDALVKMTAMNMNMTAQMQAEPDADGNASYAETCAVLESDMQSLRLRGFDTNCNDSSDAYAVEATLTDHFYYCIDSKGFSDTKGISIGTATSCE